MLCGGSWSFRVCGGLPRGVAVLGDRRPFRRNSAAWHTRAKGYSAQAVKPDVCRCAEIEKKHISSTTVSTTNVPNAFSSRAWMVRGLSRKVGSAAVGSLRDGVRTAKEEMMSFLGSGGALMARQWKRTRSWSTLMRLAFGRQLQVYQALAQTALQRHVRGLLRLRRIGGFVLFIDKEFLQPTSTASSFWPSVLRDYRARRQHEFGYWLHRQDVQLTTCPLCACGGPRLVLGGVARPQRVRESSKQSLQQCSPSHPAPPP